MCEKKRYLAMAILSDSRSIRHTYSLDGKDMDRKTAKSIAKERFRSLLKRSNLSGALYEAAAISGEKSVAFAAESFRHDPNTQGHEEIHLRINRTSLRDNWQSTLPLEESIAYAYGDFVALNAKKNYTKPRELRRRYMLARHCMRLIHFLEDPAANRSKLGNSLRVLYGEADDWRNSNTAFALDTAGNLILYRECLRVLELYGVNKGIRILFDSVRIAQVRGISGAFLHIMLHFDPKTEHELVEEVCGDEPLFIRSPYADDCTDEDVDLTK